MNTHHKFCRWICFAIGMFGCVAVQVEAEDLPNLLVLMSDDAGYADFGFQPLVADDYRSLTPRIDSIAKQGCRLSRLYERGGMQSQSSRVHDGQISTTVWSRQ